MKLWTYKESVDKITNDNDLQELFDHDNSFVNKNEMIGYFNEALTDASTEIQSRNKEYFLTKAFLATKQGDTQVALPENIMANKIRGIFYENGSINYEIKQFKRHGKFQEMVYSDKYGPNDYYGYTMMNDYSGQAVIEIHPPIRETSVLPPMENPFTPFTMWYIRNCARVPLIGEFCNPELIANTDIDVLNNTIKTVSGNKKKIGIPWQGKVGCHVGSLPYVTGDTVQLSPCFGGSLPSNIEEDNTYYVIALGNGLIQLADSALNAKNNVPIVLADEGVGGIIIRVKATEKITNNTVLDIPEFNMYLIQFVKCKILAKERDPSLQVELAILKTFKDQMMDTLTDSIQDDHGDDIEADYSAYEEMV